MNKDIKLLMEAYGRITTNASITALQEYFTDENYSPEGLKQRIEELGLDSVWNKDSSKVCTGGLIIDVEYPDIDTKTLDDFLSTSDYNDLEDWGVIEPNFNKTFWEHPYPLFHASPEENVENIKQDGLKVMNKSR